VEPICFEFSVELGSLSGKWTTLVRKTWPRRGMQGNQSWALLASSSAGSGSSADQTTAARGTTLERKLFSHLEGAAALAAKILFKLDEQVGFTGQIAKRGLERLMNANKQPRWAEAWQLLLQEGWIRVSAGKNRQQFVQLIGIPEHLQARSIETRPRERRPQTRWFQERLPEFLRRDGYYRQADEIEEGEGDDYGPLQYVPGDPLAR
jgi:hypothetical protein